MHSDFSKILDVVGALFLLLFFIQWISTIRAFHGLPWRAVWGTIGVTFHSSKVLLLFGVIVFLFYALFQAIFPSAITLFPSTLFLIGLITIGLNGSCLPPTVLYLAASRQEAILLASKLQTAVSPLKFVHLLNRFEAGAILGENIYHSDYRVEKNWQKAVRTLSAITPLIILDARKLTLPITQEIEHIIEAGLEHRTIFIYGKYDAMSDIIMASITQNVIKHTATPEQLTKALQGIGWELLSGRVKDVFQYTKNRI